MGVEKLRRALNKIERKMEKAKGPIEEDRLMKEYESKERKLKKLLGEPATSDALKEAMAKKDLDEIPEEAW